MSHRSAFAVWVLLLNATYGTSAFCPCGTRRGTSKSICKTRTSEYLYVNSQPRARYAASTPMQNNKIEHRTESDMDKQIDDACSSLMIGRRKALIGLGAGLATVTTVAQSAVALEKSTPQAPLEELNLGHGQWVPACDKYQEVIEDNSIIPASFATYASRILINYDPSVSSWWSEQKALVHLLSYAEQRNKLGKQFGCLAQTVSSAFNQFIYERMQEKGGVTDYSRAFAPLANLFLTRYGTGTPEKDMELARHIGILFSLLPPENQPRDVLNQLTRGMGRENTATGKPSGTAPRSVTNNDTGKQGEPPESSDLKVTLPSTFTENEEALLSEDYSFEYSQALNSFCVTPETVFWEIGVGDEDSPTEAIGTVFGPLATAPLTRERPIFGAGIYALLGISGGVGCALTHTVVIPLDVVKTRMQTDADNAYASMVDGAASIARAEGAQALFLGAQATIAGYLWYGLSVYPSYTFFKKFIAGSLLDPAVALLNANNVSLLAGAIAAVIASIGLTPLEACRIRTVAEPDKYRPLGLVGTAASIAAEDAKAGWGTLYAGFNSLLTRQVIFGSVKFLAFERACEAIYSMAPSLRDATATALLVSLVAGGFSGALSSVVSQPADSVLTYVAQRGEGVGVVQGCKVMIEEEGWTSLFRGLGSRCVWAGSIIAGQFLLYDVFRTLFGVNGEDLSQVFNVVIR